MKHNSAIKEIESSYATIIIDTRQPLGLFHLMGNGVYIGIDNSTGDAWTEEFFNLRQCRKWLQNPSLSAPTME